MPNIDHAYFVLLVSQPQPWLCSLSLHYLHYIFSRHESHVYWYWRHRDQLSTMLSTTRCVKLVVWIYITWFVSSVFRFEISAAYEAPNKQWTVCRSSLTLKQNHTNYEVIIDKQVVALVLLFKARQHIASLKRDSFRTHVISTQQVPSGVIRIWS